MKTHYWRHWLRHPRLNSKWGIEVHAELDLHVWGLGFEASFGCRAWLFNVQLGPFCVGIEAGKFPRFEWGGPYMSATRG